VTGASSPDERLAERLLAARSQVYSGPDAPQSEPTEEGGCGVTGFACTVPVKGRFIHEPSKQMQNRGNGKGGGIAAAGLVPEQLGISADVLESHYLLQLALLDPDCHAELERQFVLPHFDVALSTRQPQIDDYRDVGLEVRPPDVHRYAVRAKPAALKAFAEAAGLQDLEPRALEDEFVWRNSYQLNDAYYASLGEKRAFVLSHSRNLLIFKLVGYAEQNVEYYQLQDFSAHVWIAHQRYPTKGRVWHPGGAHPFVGMNEALVHNGDFANYHSVSEYLRQRNIRQQFLTDTEVSVQLFDLWDRVYHYPLEYIIESLAPTTELDLDQLPPDKQAIYREIQATHIHASPDGPWFFIIARSQADRFQLMGITDTAMLRPQVFALSDSGEVQIGLICSEKQAIDATLRSLADEDPRFCPVADKYWNARGGSSTDGGAFIFSVAPGKNGDSGRMVLSCADKFGREVTFKPGTVRVDLPLDLQDSSGAACPIEPFSADDVQEKLRKGDTDALFGMVTDIAAWPAGHLQRFCQYVLAAADDPKASQSAITLLTELHDRRFATGDKRRATVVRVLEDALDQLFDTAPLFGEPGNRFWRRIDWETRDRLVAPQGGEELLCIDSQGFPPEGEECDAVLMRQAHKLGWKRFCVYRLRGQRFHGVGLGAATDDVRIDLYGSNGDYTASGMDGLELHIHGNAQDQVAQIAKRGKLVIYGDVGQTFMYGAKGGEVFILGNGAGRPLINAVGRPRVVINGTCLDFLAESFMAGDPLNGGGFVILNGVEFDDNGGIVPLASPYPGSNLFSLASGGAIYIRDPHQKVVERQLNGGVFSPLDEKDWRLIRGYLEENERLFGIKVQDLLTVDGQVRAPQDVYRKVSAVALSVLAGSEKKK
jgi:glutamate synthase domain-containing protein 1/glutamate synthase domain-containing protein 3